MRLRILLSIIVSCCLASGVLGQSVVQVIPLPNGSYWNYAYGLAADSSHLYLSSEWSTSSTYNYGFIYTLNFSGVPTDSINPQYGYSQGLAFDGTNFFYIRRYTARCTIVKVSSTGTVLDSIQAPSGWYLGGACWDGTGLWVSNYYPNNLAKLYKYNVTTKTIVDSIQSLGLQPQGIAWDGQYLYYVNDNNDGDAEKIYQVNMTTRDTVRSWFLPEGPTSNMSPRGLAWDGRYLWLIAEPVSASSGRVLYKYDLGGSGTPDINLSASMIDFGQVRLGQQRQLSVGVENAGTAPLRVDSVHVLLNNHFVPAIATPATIQAGSSLTVPITFTPTQFGPDSAVVVFFSNDPDEGTKLLPVRGYGIFGSAIISAPSSYDFSVRRVGSSNLWRMTVQNLGGDALVISSVTVSNAAYRIDSVSYPISLDSLQRKTFSVWFQPPSAGGYSDTLRIYSNASNGTETKVALSGSGDATPLAIGQPFWTYTVPLHPVSNTTRRVRAVRTIGDISGDGKPDVIVCTDNYWTMALNGNASVGNDSLWAFNTYVSNSSAGPIGSEGDYSYQKALAIASDLNGDGYNDVVIGTGGGNEHVYAINGRTGRMLWTFGTDAPDSFSLGDITGVDVSTDFNNDGVPDVIAASAATQSGGVGGRRSIYLFNGTNGNLLWQAPALGFTHGVTAIPDISGDGVPDVIGTIGEPQYKLSAYSGANGAILWDYTVASSTGGAKEVLVLPIPGQTPDIILGAFWGPIYRIDGETGTMVWQRSTNGRDPTRLARLRDINNDGIDEIVASELIGDAICLDGATGNVLWTYPANSGMDITTCRDLNNDGYDEVLVASQNAGILVLKGNNGQLLYQYTLSGSEQGRSVSAMPDIDGNNSFEIVAGTDLSRVLLLSGGLDAGPSGVGGGNVPLTFSASPNYPNPFNPTTTIDVNLPAQSDLSFTVYDILGRAMRTYDYQRVAPGTHKIVWDGNGENGLPAASGVYFYRLKAGTSVVTGRMLLLK